ncbi:BA14K family protein [Rhizobium sp. GN54]|uniref:BA14K family protein n=1 Tax=Rhizobium sp. GN54 TaxID=2898150 RepID=UPI001E414813|nr:BA14K family protein [Rhizobium sp. GN54]MCD2183596.1 BA14K family protein [Rhizobium sp. GN54]
MARHTGRMVSTLLLAFLAAAPAPAIDALRPRHGPVVVGQDPVDALGLRRDPVDRLRGAPTYRGLRGASTYRDGYYRHRNGYWYPRWAFGTGEMLGDVTVGPGAPVYGMTPQQWCANRYRSYRGSDNSYQPLSGPRRPCLPR